MFVVSGSNGFHDCTGYVGGLSIAPQCFTVNRSNRISVGSDSEPMVWALPTEDLCKTSEVYFKAILRASFAVSRYRSLSNHLTNAEKYPIHMPAILTVATECLNIPTVIMFARCCITKVV